MDTLAPARSQITAPLLEVSGLTKRFGGLVAVRDIGFSINPGEILGLIGPNGSGKSTVMRLVMGIERPNAGSIRLGGTEIAGWPTHRIARSGIGIVFQHSRPLHRQTVLENIQLALLPDSLWRLFAEPHVERRAREIAERVGLERGAGPPALDAAVRGSAPSGNGEGAGARPAGGADRRAVRRAHSGRGRHLLGPDRRVSPRRSRRPVGRSQCEERRRARRPGAGDVSG